MHAPYAPLRVLIPKEELETVKSTKSEVERDHRALESKINIKNDELESLNKKLSAMKKKVEFKSSIEKSFESLQHQYQAKVDELEKLKRGGLGDYQVEISLQKPSFKEVTTRRGY